MILLPSKPNISLLLLKIRRADPSKKKIAYSLISVIDVLLIFFILIHGIKPAERLLTPLVSPMITSVHAGPSIKQIKRNQKTFSFAPGLASNKFKNIDFENLDTLAFFDLPIKPNGEINQETRGYRALQQTETAALFERASYFDTKVYLTLTLIDKTAIKSFLNDKSAQKTLAEQAISEVSQANVNGVLIDFEAGNLGGEYRNKFSEFIKDFGSTLHKSSNRVEVAVAVPNNFSNTIYDLEKLSNSADQIMILAYDFSVPETRNSELITPVYGYSEADYWDNIASVITSFQKSVPTEKLILERAWYGNGDRYPLYKPNSKGPSEESSEPAHVFLDSETVERLASRVPASSRSSARRNIPVIGKALEKEGILDSNVLAYALATIEHETDETFEPIDEIQGRMSARRLGYEGGTAYFGRGFIQLTHLRNYKAVGERIGMKDALAKNPSLASDPEVAAKILAAFFKDNNIANLASQGYFIAARQPVNPDLNGRKVARLALKYETD